MSSYTTHTATHTVTTTPAVNGGVDAPKSIRQIMMQGILAGTPKHEVKAEVDKLHPGSAASTKFSKHYGWYKSTMKKDGLLEHTPKISTAPTPTLEEATDEELEAHIAMLQARLAAKKSPMPEETDEERIERLQAELAARVDAELEAGE